MLFYCLCNVLRHNVSKEKPKTFLTHEQSKIRKLKHKTKFVVKSGRKWRIYVTLGTNCSY